MNFNCVFVKNRKKIQKYIKLNSVKNKVIVDVKKMIDEHSIDIKNKNSQNYLKTLIYQKLQQGEEKNKEVYYIPHLHKDFSVNNLLNIKKILKEEQEVKLLVFFKEFENDRLFVDILENLTHFSKITILEDY
jgi:hypothetical protein